MAQVTSQAITLNVLDVYQMTIAADKTNINVGDFVVFIGNVTKNGQPIGGTPQTYLIINGSMAGMGRVQADGTSYGLVWQFNTAGAFSVNTACDI